jgi:hypothetical protein
MNSEVNKMGVLEIILCIIGAFFIVSSLIVKTENLLSSIFLKVIPFFSGTYCIFYACLSSGVIKIV